MVSTDTISSNRWYHIAAVYLLPDQTLNFYVDGIQIRSNTNNIPGGTGNSDAPFMIGGAFTSENSSGTKENFHGFIEEA